MTARKDGLFKQLKIGFMEKSLLIIAREKGFRPKTFSTKWTFENMLGEGKMREGTLVNPECESNLLNEIQKWLRDKHKIFALCILSKEQGDKWCFVVKQAKWSLPSVINNGEHSYEEALESGLYEALKLIK